MQSCSTLYESALARIARCAAALQQRAAVSRQHVPTLFLVRLARWKREQYHAIHGLIRDSGIALDSSPPEDERTPDAGMSVPPTRGNKLAEMYSFARTLAECDHSFFRACKSLESDPAALRLWQAMIDFEEHFMAEINLAYIEGLTVDILKAGPAEAPARGTCSARERRRAPVLEMGEANTRSTVAAPCTNALSAPVADG